jgi:hypothetical protein
MLARSSLREEGSAYSANPSITQVPLAEGGRDVLVYTTISGAVGALVPFISMDDVDFMQTLEMVSETADPLTIAHALAGCLLGWPRPFGISGLLCANQGNGGRRSMRSIQYAALCQAAEHSGRPGPECGRSFEKARANEDE